MALLTSQCFVRAGDVSLGLFDYPAPGSDLVFNYLDSVNVTWDTFSDAFTDPWLMLWLTETVTPQKQKLGTVQCTLPSKDID
jgi:hypothetical protein